MRRIIRTMKQLGGKAAEFQEALQSAPQHAAKLRATLGQTASQFQQLREDVQSGFQDLKSHDDNHLIRSIAEVHDASDMLMEAGFEIVGVDLELGIARQAVIKLEQVEDVSRSEISSLRARHSGRKTLSAVLGCLVQACEVAHQVKLEGLPRFVVSVQLGAVPTVTVGWRPLLAFDDDRSDTEPALPPTLDDPDTDTPPPLPTHLQPKSGSYFGEAKVAASSTKNPIDRPGIPESEKSGSAESTTTSSTSLPTKSAAEATPESASPTASTAPTAKPSTLPPSPIKPTSEPKTVKGDWRKSALDRFKKMPDLNKS